MNRFTHLDGILLAAVFIPVISYLFISWGPYPDAWDIFFFAVPACTLQIQFCRLFHLKILKVFPLIVASALSFRNLFVLKYTPDLKFELPALCCLIVCIFFYHNHKKQL